MTNAAQVGPRPAIACCRQRLAGLHCAPLAGLLRRTGG